MTAFGSDNFKIHLDQGSYKPNASYGWESTHIKTATRWIPTNSLVTGSSTSRQSSIASRILFIMIFNTPSACGGVKSGDIYRDYGIRKNIS
jgi:hypothetical protein